MDAALNAVREAVASGMDWRDLARMIKVGHSMAQRSVVAAVCAYGAVDAVDAGACDAWLLFAECLWFKGSRQALACHRQHATGSSNVPPPVYRLLQEERRAGNPVAGLIDSLQLERSRVTLLLRWAQRGCSGRMGGRLRWQRSPFFWLFLLQGMHACCSACRSAAATGWTRRRETRRQPPAPPPR